MLRPDPRAGLLVGSWGGVYRTVVRQGRCTRRGGGVAAARVVFALIALARVWESTDVALLLFRTRDG